MKAHLAVNVTHSSLLKSSAFVTLSVMRQNGSAAKSRAPAEAPRDLERKESFVLANLEASLLRGFLFLPGSPQSYRETDFNRTRLSHTATLEHWRQGKIPGHFLLFPN